MSASATSARTGTAPRVGARGAVTLQERQASVIRRAIAEFAGYSFELAAAGAFLVSKAGSLYRVTEHSCECQWWRVHCAGTVLRCKHQEMVALLPPCYAASPAGCECPACDGSLTRVESYTKRGYLTRLVCVTGCDYARVL